MNQTIHTAEIHKDFELLDQAQPLQAGADLELRADLFSSLITLFFE